MQKQPKISEDMLMLGQVPGRHDETMGRSAMSHQRGWDLVSERQIKLNILRGEQDPRTKFKTLRATRRGLSEASRQRDGKYCGWEIDACGDVCCCHGGEDGDVSDGSVVGDHGGEGWGGC